MVHLYKKLVAEMLVASSVRRRSGLVGGWVYGTRHEKLSTVLRVENLSFPSWFVAHKPICGMPGSKIGWNWQLAHVFHKWFRPWMRIDGWCEISRCSVRMRLPQTWPSIERPFLGKKKESSETTGNWRARPASARRTAISLLSCSNVGQWGSSWTLAGIRARPRV